VKLKTLLAGNHGYLYLDLLVALTILSLSTVALLNGGRNIKAARIKVMGEYSQSWLNYEETITEEP
jgi:hypothetical protein